MEFEEDNRMTVPAMVLDEKASKRVSAVMQLLGCNESAAIKRIIAACRREDIIHELHPEAILVTGPENEPTKAEMTAKWGRKDQPDAVKRGLQEELRERIQDGKEPGRGGNGARQRKRGAASGPPDSPKTGAGKAKPGQRPQGAAKQGRKVGAVKLQGRDRAPKSKLPKNPPRGAKGQSRGDAGGKAKKGMTNGQRKK